MIDAEKELKDAVWALDRLDFEAITRRISVQERIAAEDRLAEAKEALWLARHPKWVVLPGKYQHQDAEQLQHEIKAKYTIEEAAKVFNIQPTTVYVWVKRGKLARLEDGTICGNSVQERREKLLFLSRDCYSAADVCRITKKTHWWIRRQIRAKKMPKPLPMEENEKKLFWHKQEIDKWFRSRK